MPASLAATRLDPRSATPMYRQIYDALRQDILQGVLRGGQRLLATRAMAQELGVSRNTVVEAVEQLLAEGYLTSHVGSGTFVADHLPDELLRAGVPPAGTERREAPSLSSRGQRYRVWARVSGEDRSRPFQLGRPALDAFPWKLWNRLVARRARELPREWLDYGAPSGYPPLCRALADHLRSARGVDCAPEQVILVRGAQQGLALAAHVLLDEGDPVWIEDPGYSAARVVFTSAGGRDVPVPVDDEGLDVAAGRARQPRARLAYVTPSHQYPLGVTMSLGRRLELLSWARETGAWIVEDDYDSEFRFAGRPLAALAGLDGGSHVIYLGTLSKVLFPALRMGYMVVPPEHADAFHGARYASDRQTSLLEQAVVTDFFEQGHFGRHVRRMRQLYAERQARLQAAVAAHLGEHVDLRTADTGLQAIGWLQPGSDDAELARRAAELGVMVSPLSSHCREARLPPAWLFGFAGFAAPELAAAVERLAQVFD